ncbi:MAG: MotA/TolQ/ExbB proton channel family protein [Gemmataceae bacterium]|nr:MotA/TolQ/ExbB proton channel family protein [Gemmataceae bacterium]
MLGLLGTVISMIQTFDALGQADGNGDLAGQASSIGLALFATALGLITAIPLVFAHVMLKDWVGKFEVKLKSAAQKLLVVVQAMDLTSMPLVTEPSPATDEVPPQRAPTETRYESHDQHPGIRAIPKR